MPGGKYLLGVDIGTSGSKGVLVDLEGNVVAHESLEHPVDSPKAGWFEQDADRIWWADLKRIMRALLAGAGVEASAIAAVGVSATCPDMLPVDANGVPLRKGILYSDTRSQQQIDQIREQFAGRKTFDAAVRSLSSESIGPKILWFREHEAALFERTHKVHSATTYLVFKLTGESVVDYATAGGYNPLFDFDKMDWDRDMCRELGLPVELFPDIRWATDLAGGVTSQAGQETGLAAGTPVIVGACDGTAEVLSVGAVEDGEATLLYGSTMCMGLVVSDRKKEQVGALAWPGALPGTYMTGMAMSTSAALTTWFRDNFGQVEQEVEAKLGINAYQLLSAQAAQVPPGSEGLIVLPYFAGERSPIYDALARGLIIGLTLSHTRKHIYRALFEGVAYGLRQNLEMMEEAGAEIKRLISTGGGIKSKLWTQIVSDVIGKDQEIVAEPLGSPYGDAFMAGYGAGIFNDVSPLRGSWAPTTSVVRHDPETKKVYDKYYQVYRELYQSNKDHMHTLAHLSVDE